MIQVCRVPLIVEEVFKFNFFLQLIIFISEGSLVPRPHLFLEVGLVNNEHFPGCAESAYHMISIATEVRL